MIVGTFVDPFCLWLSEHLLNVESLKLLHGLLLVLGRGVTFRDRAHM